MDHIATVGDPRQIGILSIFCLSDSTYLSLCTDDGTLLILFRFFHLQNPGLSSEDFVTGTSALYAEACVL